ncbi:MAG TPA: ATP-binding protein [Candidatus Brocadiaceae bacterium]|nr:ATP-binding protein [Candidatus Brocadiaceae bacterium]
MSNRKVIPSLLNQALEHASKGIMIQDTNRNVVFANHACGEITLWTKGDIVGKHCGDVFRCHTATGMPFTENLCPCVDVLTGRTSQNAREFLIYRGDGSELWVEAGVSAIKDDEGTITHTVTMLEDVDAKKKFLDDIIKTKTVSTLGAFASEVTHEIKNFLNAVNIHVFMLDREIKNLSGISNEAKQELFQIVTAVQNGIGRLSEFARDCAHFSKSGRLSKCPVDINEMLKEVFSLLTYRALLSGIHLDMDVAGDVSGLVADRDKLKQVIVHILMNGMEDMKDGGKLGVAVKRIGQEIRISCRNEGPCISEEIKNKIFDLLYTDKDGAVKMGLAVAQNVIQAHGGTINLEPSVKGNTFIITIPAS